MTEAQVIQKTRDYLEEQFSGEGAGHEWWHMYRVWRLAKQCEEFCKANNACSMVITSRAVEASVDKQN